MSMSKLLNGTLTADKLRITGGGEVVRFEGNVVMKSGHGQPDPRRRLRPACHRIPRPPDPAPVGQDAFHLRPSPANPK